MCKICLPDRDRALHTIRTCCSGMRYCSQCEQRLLQTCPDDDNIPRNVLQRLHCTVDVGRTSRGDTSMSIAPAAPAGKANLNKPCKMISLSINPYLITERTISSFFFYVAAFGVALYRAATDWQILLMHDSSGVVSTGNNSLAAVTRTGQLRQRLNTQDAASSDPHRILTTSSTLSWRSSRCCSASARLSPYSFL